VEKDNKIILFAVIILLVAMFSYNELFFEKENFGKENEKSFGKVTGNVIVNQSIDKCFIKVAKWSSTSDKYTKISTVKQGQTVYMYIETNNCKNKNLNFEVFRLRKRLLLKDSLALVSNTVKTVPDLEKLSVSFNPTVNTEDSGSSTYKFRIRFTDLPSSNTTNTSNTTVPPIIPPNNTSNQTNVTIPPVNNQSNLTGLPDLIVEKVEFKKYTGGLSPITITSLNIGDFVFAYVTFKNIGSGILDVPYLGYSNYIRGTFFVTKNDVYQFTQNFILDKDFNPGQSWETSFSFAEVTQAGKYCLKNTSIDITNIYPEINEQNNKYSDVCITAVANTTSLYPDLTLDFDRNYPFVARKSPTDQPVINNGDFVPTGTVVDSYVYVENIGDYTYDGRLWDPNAARVKIEAKKDGTLINSFDYVIDRLYAGSGFKVYYANFTVSTSAKYCLGVNVDYTNKVVESNEGNNIFSEYKCINIKV